VLERGRILLSPHYGLGLTGLISGFASVTVIGLWLRRIAWVATRFSFSLSLFPRGWEGTHCCYGAAVWDLIMDGRRGETYHYPWDIILLGLALACIALPFLFFLFLLTWYGGTLFMDMYRPIDQVVGYFG
jgi:hypothetical protein